MAEAMAHIYEALSPCQQSQEGPLYLSPCDNHTDQNTGSSSCCALGHRLWGSQGSDSSPQAGNHPEDAG